MIHYHGGPITPLSSAIALWRARHACVSFAEPRQADLAFEVCQSVILDNGAYSLWSAGAGRVDVPAYADWVRRWSRHPAFDWAVIPDAIDGDEAENDALLGAWFREGVFGLGVPVWHLHESIGRLQRLAVQFPRLALGSSGEYAEVGADLWWQRMSEAMDAICDGDGHPRCKLHGLRMLNPTIFSQLPLSSADSCNVARNIGLCSKWDAAPYTPRSRAVRALVLADRIEHHASAARWSRLVSHQFNMDLIG